jgi:hypothetical protein
VKKSDLQFFGNRGPVLAVFDHHAVVVIQLGLASAGLLVRQDRLRTSFHEPRDAHIVVAFEDADRRDRAS